MVINCYYLDPPFTGAPHCHHTADSRHCPCIRTLSGVSKECWNWGRETLWNECCLVGRTAQPGRFLPWSAKRSWSCRDSRRSCCEWCRSKTQPIGGSCCPACQNTRRTPPFVKCWTDRSTSCAQRIALYPVVSCSSCQSGGRLCWYLHNCFNLWQTQ